MLLPLSENRSYSFYQKYRNLVKGDRKSSELKMTEKTVQPGEENCGSHTGDSKTDRTFGTQEALVRIIYHQETQIWHF